MPEAMLSLSCAIFSMASAIEVAESLRRVVMLMFIFVFGLVLLTTVDYTFDFIRQQSI